METEKSKIEKLTSEVSLFWRLLHMIGSLDDRHIHILFWDTPKNKSLLERSKIL